MQDIDLTFTWPAAIFLLAAIGCISYSIFVYRRTNPPITDKMRYFLISLRALALMVILFLIFEPYLSIFYLKREKPITAVLIDDSASMTLEDAGQPRSKIAREILSNDIFSQLNSKIQFDFYAFSTDLKPLSQDAIDSLKFSGDATDFALALQKLSQKYADKNLRDIILISDGIYNQGQNPEKVAAELGYRIFPVSVGEPIEQKDIIVSQILTNQVTYVNNKVPVDITVFSRGYENQKIKVNLFDGNNLIDSKVVSVGNPPERKLQLFFTPESPGFKKYIVNIPPVKGELTELNNSKSFYVKVLKNKIRILYLAGAPEPDFSFIKRALLSDKNLSVDFLIAKRGSGFYFNGTMPPADSLKNFDLLILHNFPPRRYKTAVIGQISQFLKENDLPIFFIAGNGNNDFMLSSLNQYLPVQFPLNHQSEKLIQAVVTKQGKIHPVTEISDDEFINQKLWSELPPIFVSSSPAKINPGSTVLLESAAGIGLSSRRQGQPILIAQRLGPHKSLAMLGYGIWRWDLLMWGINKDNTVFRTVLSNGIRWLVNKEDTKKIRIYPTDEIFRGGQALSFAAQIYNDNYKPLDNVEVSVQIQDTSGHRYDLLLTNVGQGKYEGSLEPLPGGDYYYAGKAVYQNREIGSDEGKFSVEEFNLEFLETKINQQLLENLASLTNGKILKKDQISQIGELLSFQVRKSTITRQWQLWHQLIFLIISIVLLAIEWFFRKKLGLL